METSKVATNQCMVITALLFAMLKECADHFENSDDSPVIRNDIREFCSRNADTIADLGLELMELLDEAVDFLIKKNESANGLLLYLLESRKQVQQAGEKGLKSVAAE